MTALTLNNLLDLVPGEVYTAKSDPNSNVYKALQVKQQIFADLFAIAEQIRLLKDISTISGIASIFGRLIISYIEMEIQTLNFASGWLQK